MTELEDNRTVVSVSVDKATRIDRYISENLGIFSRSQIKNRNVRVFLNGCESKLSKKTVEGDTLEIFYSLPEPLTVEPEEVPLSIIYENADVLVLNKPQGVVVHPAPGNYHGTMVQGILYYLKEHKNAFPDEELRPGIVHRLDKDTSGVIIAAKNPKALEFLSNQFREKTAKKKYIALCKGLIFQNRIKVETKITRDPGNRKKFTVSQVKGKHAVTECTVVKRSENSTFVVLSLHTGRTHQLRVHMLSIGHPIVGDPLYGRRIRDFDGSTLMLHSSKLSIKLPGEETVRDFYAPIPPRFYKFFKNKSDFKNVSDDNLQEYF